MKSLILNKSKDLQGKKLSLSVRTWTRSMFRFLKRSFFPSFFLSRLSYFCFLLQSKNFNFLDLTNFRSYNFSKDFLSGKLVKSTNNSWENADKYFFCEFKILGLGLRLKKSTELNLRSINLDLGYSHYINYFLPPEVKCIRRKKKFVIFSYDLIVLNQVIQHLEKLKPLNPYKIRGLKNIRRILVTKIGKKQSQR
jgi:ribosomal protein L6P/L9E